MQYHEWDFVAYFLPSISHVSLNKLENRFDHRVRLFLFFPYLFFFRLIVGWEATYFALYMSVLRCYLISSLRDANVRDSIPVTFRQSFSFAVDSASSFLDSLPTRSRVWQTRQWQEIERVMTESRQCAKT